MTNSSIRDTVARAMIEANNSPFAHRHTRLETMNETERANCYRVADAMRGAHLKALAVDETTVERVKKALQHTAGGWDLMARAALAALQEQSDD